MFERRIIPLTDKAGRRLLAIVSSTTFLRLTFLWFIIQAVYFAVSVRYGLPPDENYHYSYIQLFAQHFPSPFLPNQGSYNVLIESVHNPFFLYHYLLSLPYFLFKNFDNAYIILRLINVAMGVGSLYLIYKIAKLVKVSALVRNLTIFMLSSTLMFVFLAGAINYDNLAILLSLASVYLLLKLLKKITARELLFFPAALLGGLMVKITFLPLAFIVFVLLLGKYFRRLPAVYLAFKKSFSVGRKLNMALVVMVVLLGGLFIQRYASNIVTYGSYAPACQKVRSLEDCRKSDLFARNESVYAPGHKTATQNPLEYTLHWGKLMEQRTFGVYAHQRFSPDRLTTAWVSVMLIVSLVAFIKKWQARDHAISLLLFISLSYLLALLINNYFNYHNSGILQLAVHGRYAFAVLPLLYLIANHYTEKFFKNHILKASYVLATIIIFFISSLPTYLHKTTPDWHAKSQPPKISRQASDGS